MLKVARCNVAGARLLRMQTQRGMASSTFAIAFDVDGVLLKGNEPVPGARNVLSYLSENKIPHVFMTNGGGSTENIKAQSMSERLDVRIEESQIVLGHTPMRSLRQKHSDDSVLVVGKHYEKLSPILHEYGIKNTITTEEYHQARPNSYSDLKAEGGERMAEEPDIKGIQAIFCMNDPLYWGRDLQIMYDVVVDSAHQVPIYSACADLLYSSDYHHPRFGNGSFRHAFNALYEAVHGEEYSNQVLYGKPNKISYDYVEELLLQDQHHHIEAIYMIGDNPETDILGARLAGGKWRSILTLSGLFNGEGEHHADALVSDVNEALAFIKSRHKLP
eukprot:jgi/Bigna1/89553/estExt_fgenesh1_pg.C_510104